MISYGGREEIVRATRALAQRVAAGELDAEGIDEATFERELFTAGLPDPDLLIRTSGEYRVSNFMLWQLAYTELHITPVFWPDFTREHLFEAVLDYQHRERRFGRVPTP
jgi:undecaprenyl diphosphate synthase